MSTWLAVESDILRHSKTFNLKRILNLPTKRDAVGIIVSLLIFTLEHAWEDGNLEPHGTEAIADACEWGGDPTILLKALQECGGRKDGVQQIGFLNGWVVHNWVKRASRLIRERLHRMAQKDAQAAGKTRLSDEVVQRWNAFAQKHNLDGIDDAEFPGRVSMVLVKLEQLLQAAEKQPFLFGTGDDAWKMDFNWILSPRNQQKILSMKYLRNGAVVPVDDWSERSSKLLRARKVKGG